MSYHNMVLEDGLLAPERFFESCIGRGWWPIVRKLCGDIDTMLENKQHRCMVLQVKEKFGGLRFYFRVLSPEGATDDENKVVYQEVRKLVQEAEGKAAGTCEVCGQEGKGTVDGRWMKTLCEDCKKEQGRR